MNLDEIIDDFNDGEFDVELYFNDYNTFFNILNKRGLLDKIDFGSSNSDEWQNEYLIWLYDVNRKKFYDFVLNAIGSDLEQDDNGKIYYVTNNISDLSDLFCQDRYDISRDTIGDILAGESDLWRYWDTTDDVYRDVIEELTPENDKRLQEYIVNTLKETQIEPVTEELDLIASEQGHPEYVLVTPENVKRIIDDKKTMEFLFDNELEDLKSELYSIHSSAYNSAYETEIWNNIWYKIQEYFDGRGNWISRPHTYKKDTTVNLFKIPVASNFDEIILGYLNDGAGSRFGTLEYYGSYLGILTEYMECLNVYAPDYPNFKEVDENINSYFADYI